MCQHYTLFKVYKKCPIGDIQAEYIEGYKTPVPHVG